MDLRINAIMLTIGAVVAGTVICKADEEPNYMRSSIFPVLVKSDKQNQRIKEENEKVGENEFIAIAQGFAKTAEKKAANEAEEATDITQLPQVVFLSLPVPDNFNAHMVGINRVVDFDAIRANLSDDDINAFKPKASIGKKFGGLMKGLAGAAMSTQESGESTLLRVEEVDDAMPAVLNSYFKQNNVPASLTAHWYGYNPSAANKWTMDTLVYRFNQSMSAEDADKAAANPNYRTILETRAEEMINKTYVVAINFRFRSNKALLAELEQTANMASGLLGGGALGSLATKAAGAGAAAAMGDGFTVQAYTALYTLDWNKDNADRFYTEFFDKNASLEDLVNSGICTLTPVGKPEKSSARVRQSKFSDKPISDLVKRATARAYDEALAKLQVSNEEFRIITPISKVDEKGNVYARIGMKEGIEKGDEYEILEPNEDADGHVTYKAVGKVKAVDKAIWNNRFGAVEEAAENSKADVKDADKAADSAVSLGYTTFAGAKKGQDYSGYYLRLKKKK